MQAKEFGEAEVWMNERLMRVAPRSVAEFITAFEEQRPETKRRKSAAPEPLWLVSGSRVHHIQHIAALRVRSRHVRLVLLKWNLSASMALDHMGKTGHRTGSFKHPPTAV